MSQRCHVDRISFAPYKNKKNPVWIQILVSLYVLHFYSAACFYFLLLCITVLLSWQSHILNHKGEGNISTNTVIIIIKEILSQNQSLLPATVLIVCHNSTFNSFIPYNKHIENYSFVSIFLRLYDGPLGTTGLQL